VNVGEDGVFRSGAESSVAKPAFELRGVSYHYRDIPAIRNLNLSLPSESRLALLGPNGSGKSTLLRILDGLCFPQKGSVFFRGEPLTEERLGGEEFSFQFRRSVGLVFQNPDVQLFSPTVFDEVAFGPLQLGWSRNEIRGEVAKMLDSMEISHLRDRTPQHLSMGEKKRVALASVLILNPDVLLLDEPTSALDPRSESRMIDFLIGCAQSSKTIVTATHDLDVIEDIAETCYVFQDGCVVAQGSAAEILANASILERTGLVHSHLHKHASGEVHAHPHLHRHAH
jgi:cobalt/nickel transport system ATP-binding protein